MEIHPATDEIAGGSVLIEYWWAYPLLGAGTGLCAGLLGVGGGLIMVPVLSAIFRAEGFPQQYVMHLALGTSIATIFLPRFPTCLAIMDSAQYAGPLCVHSHLDWCLAR